MTDLMQLTKKKLIELLLGKDKLLLGKDEELDALKVIKDAEVPAEKKLVRKKFPIEPKCPFEKMGKLEYHRWRVRLQTWYIENDNGKHNTEYIDQEKRNRLWEMQQFIKWFEILIKDGIKGHNEAKVFQPLYDEYIGKILPAEKKLIVKTVLPNESET